MPVREFDCFRLGTPIISPVKILQLADFVDPSAYGEAPAPVKAEAACQRDSVGSTQCLSRLFAEQRPQFLILHIVGWLLAQFVFDGRVGSGRE